jgi:hypothetical protein
MNCKQKLQVMNRELLILLNFMYRLKLYVLKALLITFSLLCIFTVVAEYVPWNIFYFHMNMLQLSHYFLSSREISSITIRETIIPIFWNTMKSSHTRLIAWEYFTLWSHHNDLKSYGSRVRFTARAGNFTLNHSVQNGPAAQPASYTIGTSGSFPGSKAAGLWSWPLTSV